MRPIRSHRLALLLLAASVALPHFAASLGAQTIRSERGVDARVDYAGLLDLAPWDDRNYNLTREDLALLAPNEAELDVGIPLFYRVELRRQRPGMLRVGPVQYPRASVPSFRALYSGYLVDGQLYSGLEKVDGKLRVDLSEGTPVFEFLAQKVLEGEAKVTSPNGAAESAVAINPVNTDVVIAGTNGPGPGQKMHYSTDGGVTWNAAAALPQGNTCCDPTVAWSSDGTKGYTATLADNLGGNYIYRTADGGQTWTDLATEPGGDPRREVGSNVDKEFIHVDISPSSAHQDNIYLTWHENNTLKFSRSLDRAHTWSSPINISSGGSELGIGSDITSDSAGNVYYFWPAFNSQTILMRKSTNGGSSFQPTVTVANTQASFTFPIPSIESRAVFVYASADTDRTGGTYDDSIYVSWTDSTAPTGGGAAGNHSRIQVAYSRNGGASWTVTTPHETADANSVDRWHQWLAVGPDGRVHVVFYDTRRDPSRQSVDLFYSVSSDGAQTWSAPTRLTAQQSPNIADGFEFGDYNGLDVVLNDLIAIYTDNRQEGGGGGDSVDVYVAGTSLGGNTPPNVTISAPSNGSFFSSGTSIQFAGSATDAQDGTLTSSLAWTSSLDGSIGTGGSFMAVLSDGNHVITASVTDSGGATGSANVSIDVGNVTPTVTITSPANGSSFEVGTSVAFAGTASDPEDGDLTVGLSWSSSLDGAIGSGGSVSQILTEGTHTVTASATDSGGSTGSDSISVTIHPPCGAGGLSESFDISAAGWSTSGLWHRVENTPCASPGSSSAPGAMYYGQDATCDYDTGSETTGDLTSPAISGIAADSTLSFDYFRNVEDEPSFEADITTVEVTGNGGSSWTELWRRDSTDFPVAGWQSSGDLSLAAFAGDTIQVRFHFDSVDDIANDFIGWLIDDVEVTACGGGGGGGDEIFSDGFESGDTSAWQ